MTFNLFPGGGLFSTPSKPDPAPPPPPPKREDPEVKDARDRQRRSELRRKGRQASILTSGQGVEDDSLGITRPTAGGGGTAGEGRTSRGASTLGGG